MSPPGGAVFSPKRNLRSQHGVLKFKRLAVPRPLATPCRSGGICRAWRFSYLHAAALGTAMRGGIKECFQIARKYRLEQRIETGDWPVRRSAKSSWQRHRQSTETSCWPRSGTTAERLRIVSGGRTDIASRQNFTSGWRLLRQRAPSRTRQIWIGKRYNRHGDPRITDNYWNNSSGLGTGIGHHWAPS